MTQQLRIVVSGLIAQYPLGGVTWDYLQYLLGLHLAGHDVYYLEDTGFWPFNPQQSGLSSDGCTFNVNYLNSVCKAFGMEDRWMYRVQSDPHPDNDTYHWFGLSDSKRKQVLSSADLLINVSGCLAEPGLYREKARLAYIDSDPVFTQIKLALGKDGFEDQIAGHDRHFTFAENPGHRLVDTVFDWYATRQPVVLREWQNDFTPASRFTTVMNWTSYDAVHLNGIEYGQKDVEFNKFIDLPAKLERSRYPTEIELAVNQGKTTRTPHDLLRASGWHLVDPNVACADLWAYRNFITGSKAEWSVAKQGYVKGQSGWFSCRSACYLAAGRPVVVQDTGFSSVYPTGVGLHAFTSVEEALVAIQQVQSNYQSEQAAASEIAQEYFDSIRVLDTFIEQAMCTTMTAKPIHKGCVTGGLKQAV